ncbi:MAG: DUF1800 domain-containing protein, partial [Rhizomicrobium sp.]
GDLERIVAMGTEAYLNSQLHPQTGTFPQNVVSVLRGLPSFGMNSADAYAAYWWKDQVADPKSLPKEEKKKLKRREKQVTREAQIARVARAVGSPWQLHEALVEFWFNHFNVYEKKGAIKVWIGSYEEEAIRPHTLGRFSDLLLATARHPAMLVYLDNAQNVAPVEGAQDEMSGTLPGKKNARGINENYAREVMELHTLGVDGGYTQADVISLAHILTGWTVGPGAESDVAMAAEKFGKNKGAFRFARGRHDPSAEILLGRRFSGDGASEGEAALLMLAAHPATAHHISFQLAQYFVADTPDPELVAAMATTFRGTGGDIRAVLTTMLAHRAFLAPANFGMKFKTPYRYVVSAARASAIAPPNVRPLVRALTDLGQPLYGCISPDGYACTQSAWLDPDGLLHRVSLAMQIGSGAFGGIDGAGDFDPPDPDRILAAVGPALGSTTLAVLARTPRATRAGAILGGPDFMRC